VRKRTVYGPSSRELGLGKLTGHVIVSFWSGNRSGNSGADLYVYVVPNGGIELRRGVNGPRGERID